MRRRGLSLLVLLCAFARLQAQQSELPQLFAQGMAAFQAGDFAKAANDLETLANKAEFTPQLEPVFFTVGSAYFNAGNYSKAIAAFKNYQTKFPGGPHAADAAFGLAQSNLLTKNYADAAAQFSALEKDPKLREQALLAQATALKEGNKADQAIPVLEKLVGTELKSAAAVRGAMMLAQLYVAKGAADKAVQTLARIHEQLRLVDNIVELNATTVELGDQLFQKKLFADALECYRIASPRDQIVRMQTGRISAMQQAIEANLNAARADPSQVGQLGAVNNQLKADMTKAQNLLGEFQKLPDYSAAIYIRMARAFYEIDKKWEAIVVYQELLDRYPNVPERETALFGMIVSLAEVNQPQRAMKRCEEYLSAFKNGPNAETVGYLLGASALQANDPRAAETYFGKMLETPGKGTYREQMRYLLGNAKFMAGKHDEAVAEYQKYLQDFPKGQNVEDVVYRIALSALFSGKYEEAIKQLTDYLAKYPQGAFVSDARYRLAVCKYSASLYEGVIGDCKSWEADFPMNQQLGEVLALLADSYAATDREEDAIREYIRSYKAASTDEVMNYSLFAASKLLQKRGDWNRVSDLFSGFIEEKPDHPTVIQALYWIGKAKAHEGQVDEAKKISADTIKKYIGNPQREAVEMLLTQLAQLCAKKKQPVAGETVGDPATELDNLLGESEQDSSPTAKARILFAKAELARLRKQPAEEDKNIALIAQTAKPEDLSPVLLGHCGDYLLGKGKLDEARKFYERLMEEFPRSDNIDFGYNGLGEIALQKGDLPKALRYFSEGTDKIAASQKLKDLTVGKAKTLMAMGRLIEARKLFEQIASVHEWRGESTAFSVYSLGEIEAKQSHWAEANAYFQRVYVGYQKFLPWVAKAYMRSAESFEKLGKTQEAANTYRELLRNEKLAGFAEAEEAKKKLAAMGQQG
jgi:TolA-binding protein